MSEPVSQEEADRIKTAKAMYNNIDTAPPTSAQLNQVASDDAARAGDAEALKASHDEFVRQYIDAPAATGGALAPAGQGGTGNTPAEPAAQPAQSEGTGTQSAGTNAEPSAPPASQIAVADAEAQRRAEFNKLQDERRRTADARLNNGGAHAVLLSKGGMQPSSDTVQITQGPEVKESDRLLGEIENNAVRAAGGEATAGLKRDEVLGGLETQHSQANAKLAGAEQQAQQQQSNALSAVADRMSKALENAPPVVSPAQDLNNMGMGQKLAFVLASAGGAMAGRATGENRFLQGYNQMVDARIKTQEQEAAAGGVLAKGQENLYGVMRQGFQSDDAARSGMRLMYAQALQTKMNEAAIHYNIDMANPHYQKMQADIAQQILTAQMELAKISGQHISEEKTARYAPPQVAVVGGGDKGDAKAREDLDKYWTTHKLYDKEADLDTINNIVRDHDKQGLIAQYVASHPGASYANAYFALVGDPTQRQQMVDTEESVKSAVSGNGMRSELGRQLGQTLANPQNSAEKYNRLSHEFQTEAAAGIAAHGGYDAYRRWRQNTQDIQDTTGSLVRPQGAKELPNALPRVEGAVPPPSAASANTAPAASHHKKK